MGWSGRAPAPPAIEAGKGRQDKEHAMSQTQNATIAVVGIDIGKNSFHIVGHDERGAIVLRQKWSRGQVEARFAANPGHATRCPVAWHVAHYRRSGPRLAPAR